MADGPSLARRERERERKRSFESSAAANGTACLPTFLVATCLKKSPPSGVVRSVVCSALTKGLCRADCRFLCSMRRDTFCSCTALTSSGVCTAACSPAMPASPRTGCKHWLLSCLHGAYILQRCDVASFGMAGHDALTAGPEYTSHVPPTELQMRNAGSFMTSSMKMDSCRPHVSKLYSSFTGYCLPPHNCSVLCTVYQQQWRFGWRLPRVWLVAVTIPQQVYGIDSCVLPKNR